MAASALAQAYPVRADSRTSSLSATRPSTYGPEPAIPPAQRCSGVLRRVPGESMPSVTIEVAWRNCALGASNRTSTVFASSAEAPA